MSQQTDSGSDDATSSDADLVRRASAYMSPTLARALLRAAILRELHDLGVR